MNWLKFLVAFAAFLVAGCAAYFSVTGLGVLFSGASIAVMVMASALEFAKLVTASYLKQAWDSIGKLLKAYLVLAVVILMLVTSAGIFGYLSNAFQQQNLKIQQVDREISIWNTKIETSKEQIKLFNEQLNSLQQNQGKLIDLQQGSQANNRLLKSVDNRDNQILQLSTKIDALNTEIVSYNDTINKIKSANIDIEREVGGFRFVAEAFGVDLNTVVKFFIFLIVFVFDPLAIALVIAFNNLLKSKNSSNTEKNDVKLYEVYGETQKSEEKLEDEVEDVIESDTIAEPVVEDVVKLEPTVESVDEIVDEFELPAEIIEDETKLDEFSEETKVDNEDLNWLNANGDAPYYTHPNFPWEKKHLWQNDQKAVQYWMSQKK